MTLAMLHTETSPVLRAVDRLRAGGFVAVVDAADRMDQAHLVIAGQHVTPEAVTFMACEARGLVCAYVGGERCDELELYPQVRNSGAAHGSRFTVSVEARTGTTTGISAADRAHTIRTLADPASGAEDLVVPGHIFPLRARAGGVRTRAGHTEAAIELAELADLHPVVASCAILDADGDVARGDALHCFCLRHDIPLLHIADLIDWLRT